MWAVHYSNHLEAIDTGNIYTQIQEWCNHHKVQFVIKGVICLNITGASQFTGEFCVEA